jgi:Protein of unknown function (DUF2924)
MRRPSGDLGAASPLVTPRSDNAGSVEDVIAGLADLDAKGLRLQWRNHLGGTPPAHLPRWPLLRVFAYEFQVAALGGPDKATLRVIRQSKGRTLGSAGNGPFEARIASTREGADLRAGALLVREWKGELQRVTVPEKGFAWNGKSYSSLSQIAKAITGTAWNGHRFFGCRTATSARASRMRRATVSEATARSDVVSDGPTAIHQVGDRCSSPNDVVASAVERAALIDRDPRRNDAGTAT